MNVTKNPIYKRRGEIASFLNLTDANGEIIAKLVYTLGKEFPREFYPKNQKKYLDCYKDSIGYIDDVPDREIRTYRLHNLIKDAPYIDWKRAEGLLACLELSASEKCREVYTNKVFRETLVENVYLMLHTLHADFGFGEERIARVATAWSQCSLEHPLDWLKELVGEDLHKGCEAEVIKLLDKRTYRTQSPTVREQLDAEKYMEEFKSIMEVIL